MNGHGTLCLSIFESHNHHNLFLHVAYSTNLPHVHSSLSFVQDNSTSDGVSARVGHGSWRKAEL